jgi:hypothetical protein
MARTIDRLSPVQLRRLPTGMHLDGAGLYLRVDKEGARSWIFRYMRYGYPRQMGLGPLHTVSLKEARQSAIVDALIDLRVQRLTAVSRRRSEGASTEVDLGNRRLPN